MLRILLGLSALARGDVIEWLRSNGGVAQGVEAGDFGDMGRGLRCTRAIDEDALVLRVPLDVVLSGSRARTMLGLADVSDEDAIGLLLLAERAKGRDSTWFEYLNSLPHGVVSLKTMNDAELEWLDDERLASRGRQARARLNAEYARLEPLIVRSLEAACGGNTTCVATWSSKDAFTWSHGIVDSRALTFRGARYLVPAADLVNYAPQKRDRRKDGGVFFLKYHRLTDDAIETYADRPCAAGTQYVEDYGDNANLIYVEHHGFVPDENPMDCAAVDLPSIDAERIAYLKSLGERGPPASCLPISVERASLSLQRYFWAATAELPLEGDPEPLPAMCAAANAALKRYSTSVAEDNALLLETTTPPAQRLAIRYRRSQKRLLDSFTAHECECQPLEKRVADFNQWATAQGWPALKVEAAILSSHGGRLGAVATDTIVKNEPYLAVPEKACLRATLARETMPVDRFDDFHALLFLLLREVARGKQSEWAPYIALLPDVQGVQDSLKFDRPLEASQRRDAPLLWDDSERRRLRTSALADAVLEYNRTVDAAWRSTLDAFRATPQLQAVFGTDAVVSWPIYRWAVQTLDSRSIWWNGARHLVPMLDLVNAASTDELPADAPVHRTHLVGGAAVTRAATHFEAGDQVVEDYGQPNHILFLYHGFVLPVNKHDCLRVHVKNAVFCLKPGAPPNPRFFAHLARAHGLELPQKTVGLPLLLALQDDLQARIGDDDNNINAPPEEEVRALLAAEHKLLTELRAEVELKCRHHEAFVDLRRS